MKILQLNNIRSGGQRFGFKIPHLPQPGPLSAITSMSQQNLKYRNWSFSVDKQRTSETYEGIKTPGAESCGCDNCLNFAAQRANIYPIQIKELLTALGIDWNKETEISHYTRTEDGQHHYGGWFHFKGNFEGKNCEIPLPSGGFTFDLTSITDNFSIGFRHDSSLSVFTETDELVQVEFECKIPWILVDKPEPE